MVDKTKTIKGATDKELDELIRRLRKESELQFLIGDIKRKASPYPSSYDDNQSVSTEEPIDSMYHFGVMGMKWGRKRAKPSGPSSQEHQTKEILSKKHLRELSNADIKILTERLQLEKKYRELTKKQMSPGKKFVKDLLVNQGKQLLTDYLAKNGVAGIRESIGKMRRTAAS